MLYPLNVLVWVWEVDKAYHIATNGYPGAVHLSLPVDIMFSSFEEDVGLEERPFSQKAKPLAKAWPDPNSLIGTKCERSYNITSASYSTIKD